jgi:hypothetical protein
LGNENIMARITFTALSTNGTTVKRTSESKTYTHAVVNETGALSWAGSEALAQKAATTFRNRGHEGVAVVPVLTASSKVEAAPLTETVYATAEAAQAASEAAEIGQAVDASIAKLRKAEKAAKPAEKAAKVNPADTPERKAERKMVEKRRAAGESWGSIAKDLGMSGQGVRNRYSDLIPLAVPRKMNARDLRAFSKGYQEALQDIQAKLDADGEAGVAQWIFDNIKAEA